MTDLNEFYRTLNRMFDHKSHKEIESYMVINLTNTKNIGDLNAEIAIRNELGGFYRTSRLECINPT